MKAWTLAQATTVLFSLLTTDIQARECVPGKHERFVACDQLSTTALWNEDTEDDCMWAAPPGYAILEATKTVNSEHNGSSSVSVVAENSSFATEQNYSAARERLNEISGSSYDRAYEGKIHDRLNNGFQSAHSFTSTNNVIYATVRASGSGNWYDQWRGWENITVIAHVICRGAPNEEQLVSGLLDGIPMLKPVHLHSRCSTSNLIFVYLHGGQGSWGWSAQTDELEPPPPIIGRPAPPPRRPGPPRPTSVVSQLITERPESSTGLVPVVRTDVNYIYVYGKLGNGTQIEGNPRDSRDVKFKIQEGQSPVTFKRFDLSTMFVRGQELLLFESGC